MLALTRVTLIRLIALEENIQSGNMPTIIQSVHEVFDISRRMVIKVIYGLLVEQLS